jgi:hypothetical protein
VPLNPVIQTRTLSHGYHPTRDSINRTTSNKRDPCGGLVVMSWSESLRSCFVSRQRTTVCCYEIPVLWEFDFVPVPAVLPVFHSLFTRLCLHTKFRSGYVNAKVLRLIFTTRFQIWNSVFGGYGHEMRPDALGDDALLCGKQDLGAPAEDCMTNNKYTGCSIGRGLQLHACLLLRHAI